MDLKKIRRAEFPTILDDQSDSFTQNLHTEKTYSDPLLWTQERLGVNLFSNQIETTEHLFNPQINSFNVVHCRGAGKSVGIADGLAALCSLKPGMPVIVVAPIQPQATRLIRFVKEAMIGDSSKVRSMLDLQSSSALRLVWKNGSIITGVSGQEKAHVEGEHAPIIVIDEAHLVPSHSIKSKIMPMLMSKEGFRKVVKMGVSIGKGHFHSSFMAPDAINSVCPWNKAEVYLHHESGRDSKPLFYKGKQYSQQLVDMMPLPYKVQYFPDRPDLQKVTGLEITELEWLTQYELEWVDDINNLLSDEDQKVLGAGEHIPMTQGASNRRFFAGLDTAGGSITGRRDTDRTILAIWELHKNGMVSRVASYQWVGNIVEQKQEIWDICNPKTGLFRCELVMADHSNIAQEMVPAFRTMGMPIFGVAFGGSAKAYGSVKNWKNTLFDHFLVGLQSGIVHYPNVEKMKLTGPTASDEEKVQIENMMEGFWEWCVIQRIRGCGLNDQIEAPTDTVEDEDGGMSRVAHDDHCSADVCAVFSARYAERLKKDLVKSGGLIGYEIPKGVIGGATTSAFGPNAANVAMAGGKNPLAERAREQAARGADQGDVSSGSIISDFISMNIKK